MGAPEILTSDPIPTSLEITDAWCRTQFSSCTGEPNSDPSGLCGTCFADSAISPSLITVSDITPAHSETSQEQNKTKHNSLEVANVFLEINGFGPLFRKTSKYTSNIY